MFILNKNVIIFGNRIIAAQNMSTPGVYKIFNVKPSTSYNIFLNGIYLPKAYCKIWIADINNNKLLYEDITKNVYIINSYRNRRLKIGVLFSGTFKNGDFFFLNDIMIDEIKNNPSLQAENLNEKEDKKEDKKENRKENKKRNEKRSEREKMKMELTLTNDLLIQKNIAIQICVSNSIKFFESFARKKYKLVPYYDINKPTLFYGCYNDVDLYRISDHKGEKAIIWGGTDILRENRKMILRIKNLKHIAQSDYIVKDLKKLKKSHIYLPFCPTVDYKKYYPVKKGKCIYIYTNAKNQEFYGSRYYKKIIKKLPNIKFIIASNLASLREAVNNGINCRGIQSFKNEDIINVYKKCFLALRLVKHDGISATVQELGLMGIKTIHNGNTPSSINYKSYDDILKIINEEVKNIDIVDYELSKKVKKHLQICDDLLPYVFKPIEIMGEIYRMKNYDSWKCGNDKKIKLRKNKWILVEGDKILYENYDVNNYIPPKDKWIIYHPYNGMIENRMIEDKKIEICITIIMNNNNNNNNIKIIKNIVEENWKKYEISTFIYYRNKIIENGKIIDIRINNINQFYDFLMRKFGNGNGNRNENNKYYYFFTDNYIISGNIFDESIKLYNSINDDNKIILNLYNYNNDRENILKKYNNKIYLTNNINIECFMCTGELFRELGYKINNVEMNLENYITYNMNKKGKNIYLAASDDLAFRNHFDVLTF